MQFMSARKIIIILSSYIFNRLILHYINKKAVLSQEEPRDAVVSFDTYRILQKLVDNGTFMYAKQNTATLSTRTHLTPKPAQNTLNHV